MAPKPRSLPRGLTALFVPTVCIGLLASPQDYRIKTVLALLGVIVA
jgi:hypothetical protein